MPSRADVLRDEFTKVRSGIDTIETRAVTENRDLSDDEHAQVAQLFARAEEIGKELEPIVDRQRSIDATAKILASLDMAGRANGAQVVHGPGPTVTDVSAGEYFASYARAAWPGNPNRGPDLQAHVERYRTVAAQVTADNAGILPTPILGPAVNFIDANRYVVPTMTPRPMPNTGKTFTRPRITQHVDIGLQAAELDELTSQKMTTTGDTVTKRTYGGSLQLSQQDVDWTDPASLDLVFADFVDVYAKKTDAAAAASLLAACPAASIAWVGTSVGTILSTFATAATSIYNAASVMPTDVWVDLGTGLTLSTLTTSQGDLVFPQIGNGRLDASTTDLGISLPIGLRLHVCPNFSANTRIMGNAKYAEWFEQRNGFLQVTFPSALKIELAYSGYVASYFRSEGLVRLYG